MFAYKQFMGICLRVNTVEINPETANRIWYLKQRDQIDNIVYLVCLCIWYAHRSYAYKKADRQKRKKNTVES